MSSLLQDLETRRNDHHALEELFRSREFPVVDGSRVVFVWRGHADAVLLQHWIYGLPSSQPFERLPGSDIWHLTMELPAESRIEYKIELRQGVRRQLVCDPLNERFARDPYGANSVVYGQGYEFPDWAEQMATARQGEVHDRQISTTDLGQQDIQVYLPARFRNERRYPLLILHDGRDYLRFTDLKTILDNLIHRLEIPPMVVALTQSNDRLVEYADDERHARFLVEDLLPVLEADYPLVRKPEARALGGASFGAVASLACAWRHPGVFGKLLLQSGSFAFTDIGDHDRGPVFDPVVRFVNDFRAAPGKPARKAYVSCGIYESLIYYNRSLVPLFRKVFKDVRFREARDGHNWENWRDRLREGLSWLFPGPLWMVYE